MFFILLVNLSGQVYKYHNKIQNGHFITIRIIFINFWKVKLVTKYIVFFISRFIKILVINFRYYIYQLFWHFFFMLYLTQIVFFIKPLYILYRLFWYYVSLWIFKFIYIFIKLQHIFVISQYINFILYIITKSIKFIEFIIVIYILILFLLKYLLKYLIVFMLPKINRHSLILVLLIQHSI